MPPETSAAFHSFENNLQSFERPVNKFNALLANSVYVTTVEAKAYDVAQNAKASFRYLFVPYASLSDSAFKPTDDQLRDYLERHRSKYKVEDGRSIEYIVVPEVATSQDSADLRKNIQSLADQFRTAPNDSLFARANSDQPYNNAYLSPGDLPEKLRAQLPLTVGQVYGPFVDNNSLAVYKVTGTKPAPNPLPAPATSSSSPPTRPPPPKRPPKPRRRTF